MDNRQAVVAAVAVKKKSAPVPDYDEPYELPEKKNGVGAAVYVDADNKSTEQQNDGDDDDIADVSKRPAATKIYVGEEHRREGFERARRVAAGAAVTGMPIALGTLQDIAVVSAEAAAVRDATGPEPFSEEVEKSKAKAAEGSTAVAIITMPAEAVATTVAEFQTNAFLTRVFGIMCVGVLITAAVAWYVSTQTTFLQTMIENEGYLVLLMVFELILVVALVLLVNVLTYTQAAIAFFVYAVMNGLSIAPIFAAYQLTDIYIAFLSSAGLFAILTVVGVATTTDLTSAGAMLGASLSALCWAMLLNLFFHSSTATTIISLCAVVIFAGLTVYDVQKIKDLGQYLGNKGGSDAVGSYAILGALQLYLDFINLMLQLLSAFGRR